MVSFITSSQVLGGAVARDRLLRWLSSCFAFDAGSRSGIWRRLYAWGPRCHLVWQRGSTEVFN